jgi:hypothetical protein
MWARYLKNVQRAVKSGRLTKNEDIADFIASEYDKIVKTGGDRFYKVNVINGNKEAMSTALKNVLDKNSKKEGENIDLSEDLTKVFDAYWIGAEYSPIPNPLLKPQGWAGTTSVDMPQCVILGPNFVAVASSAAKNKAKVEILKQLVDAFKSQTITITTPKDLIEKYLKQTGVVLPDTITINVYDAAVRLLKKQSAIDEPKELSEKIEKLPIIKKIKDLLKKLKEARAKKASAGTQLKKGKKKIKVKIDRKKIIKEALNKLIDQFVEKVEALIEEYLQKSIILNLIKSIETAIENLKEKPNPIPTRENIKTYVENTLKGIKEDLQGVEITGIPTKEELEQIKEKSKIEKEELKKQAKELVKGLVPKIPYIEFTKPSVSFINVNKIVWGGPFVRAANEYMQNVEGTVQVLAQCGGPTSPPTPMILRLKGYIIKKGPPVPPILSGVKIPDKPKPPLPDIPPPPLDKITDKFVKNLPVPSIPTPVVKLKIPIPTIPNIPN